LHAHNKIAMSTLSIPHTDASFPVTRRTFTLPVSFEAFTLKLESTLGRYDPAALYATTTKEDMEKVVADTIGSQPLGIFAIQDHGRLLGLVGVPRKAKQYVIGDPRIAVRATGRDVRVALHAPVTILVYETEGKDAETRVEWHTAASVLGQFGDAGVVEVGQEIDTKREVLVKKLVREILEAEGRGASA